MQKAVWGLTFTLVVGELEADEGLVTSTAYRSSSVSLRLCTVEQTWVTPGLKGGRVRGPVVTATLLPPRSVVGIPSCEALVQLQPRRTYTIYVRALNVGGPSARGKPATIHTTGLCPGPHTLGPTWSVWHTQCYRDFSGKYVNVYR